MAKVVKFWNLYRVNVDGFLESCWKAAIQARTLKKREAALRDIKTRIGSIICEAARLFAYKRVSEGRGGDGEIVDWRELYPNGLQVLFFEQAPDENRPVLQDIYTGLVELFGVYRDMESALLSPLFPEMERTARTLADKISLQIHTNPVTRETYNRLIKKANSERGSQKGGEKPKRLRGIDEFVAALRADSSPGVSARQLWFKTEAYTSRDSFETAEGGDVYRDGKKLFHKDRRGIETAITYNTFRLTYAAKQK